MIWMRSVVHKPFLEAPSESHTITPVIRGGFALGNPWCTIVGLRLKGMIKNGLIEVKKEEIGTINKERGMRISFSIVLEEKCDVIKGGGVGNNTKSVPR